MYRDVTNNDRQDDPPCRDVRRQLAHLRREIVRARINIARLGRHFGVELATEEEVNHTLESTEWTELLAFYRQILDSRLSPAEHLRRVRLAASLFAPGPPPSATTEPDQDQEAPDDQPGQVTEQ